MMNMMTMMMISVDHKKKSHFQVDEVCHIVLIILKQLLREYGQLGIRNPPTWFLV